MQLIDRLKERLIVPEPTERLSPNGIDRERRRRIVLKMADPATKNRQQVITFARKVMCASTASPNSWITAISLRSPRSISRNFFP